MAKRVVIVQPYVPAYRKPFFEGLRIYLAKRGVEIEVVAGVPSGAQARRNDGTTAEWIRVVEGRSLSLLGRQINLADSARLWRKAEGVVVPLMGSSLDALRACFANDTRQAVAVWGHVAPYTSPGNRFDLAIERRMMKSADRVFAYTPGGAAFAARAGVPESKISTVFNTVDTSELAALISAERSRNATKSADRSLNKVPTLAYIGGLDASKRVSFLAEALDTLHRNAIPVRVLVAGRGSHEGVLERAVERGQVQLLGYIEGEEKARLLANSVALVNPGRVGLLAVDALAAGIPIITTAFRYHAPEFEYLTSGKSVFVSPDSPEAFADSIADFLQGAVLNYPTEWDYPRMPEMIQSFGDGVLAMLKEKTRE